MAPKPEPIKFDPMNLLVEVERSPKGFSMNRFRGELQVTPKSEQGVALSIELARAMDFLEDQDFVTWSNLTGIKLWSLTAKGREVLRRERAKQ